VKQTGRSLVDQIPDRARSFQGCNRAAKFVGEQAQRLSDSPHIAKLLIETAIASERRSAVQGSANYCVSWNGQDELLRGHFRFRVNA